MWARVQQRPARGERRGSATRLVAGLAERGRSEVLIDWNMENTLVLPGAFCHDRDATDLEVLVVPAVVEQRLILKGDVMSVYRVTELIGTSTESWEDAAATAVRTAGQTLRNLRVAEVSEQDMNIDDDGVITYRTKLRVSFKYEPES